MAFRRNPVAEEPPRCIVCQVVVTDGSLICSATCQDISCVMDSVGSPSVDWENDCADR